MSRLLATLSIRVLFGLLVLSLGSALLPPAATRAQEPRITLESKWLVLRSEDLKNDMVQLPDQFSDDRGSLMTRRYEPNWRGREDAPPTPLLIINKVWQATDVPTAQAIFREQRDAGFPEAPRGVENVGGIGLPPLGEEAAGIGGCGPCDGGVVHYRIVFRYLNAVHALYIYGSDQYAYQGVAVNWATILDERVKAVPSGPLPEVAAEVGPKAVALGIAELGQQIDQVGAEEGSDERAQWYWARFKRDHKLETAHVGPLDIYSKVWVARDIDTAGAIFAEQSIRGFPEAHETVGSGNFPMEALPNIGNENFGWSACNEDCMTEKFRFLHHRYVWRVGNVVAVIYTWGGNQDNSVNQVQFYANSMRNRIR